MNETISNFVMGNLQQLIDSIKNVSIGVWNTFLKQQVINGWLNIGFGVLLIVLLVLIVKGTLFLNKKIDDESEEKLALWVVAIFVFIAIIFIAIIDIANGVRMILNPEYYAIMDLIGLVG